MLDILLQQNIFSYKKEEKITSFIQPYGSNHVDVSAVHDFYSTWFNLSDNFFISEKKLGVIKLKTHYFILYHFMKC
jgi:hypothetical protein